MKASVIISERSRFLRLGDRAASFLSGAFFSKRFVRKSRQRAERRSSSSSPRRRRERISSLPPEKEIRMPPVYRKKETERTEGSF